jgi:hypothetical protein
MTVSAHYQIAIYNYDTNCNCRVNEQFYFRVGGSACGSSDMDQMAHVSVSQTLYRRQVDVQWQYWKIGPARKFAV